MHYELYQTARCLAERGFSDVVTLPPARLPPKEQTVGDLSAGSSPSTAESTKDSNVRFFKTRLCLFHQKGACVKGDACSYAHNEKELKASPNLIKTRLCQDWLNGRCSAENCKFAHGRHELRFTHDYFKTKLCHFWQQGGCTKGDLCRHAHGEGELRPMPIGEDCEKLSGLSSLVTTVGPMSDHYIDDEAETSSINLIPSPSTMSREAAVFEALRLAEKARELVARSTQLLAGTDGNDFETIICPTKEEEEEEVANLEAQCLEWAATEAGIVDLDHLTETLTKLLLSGNDDDDDVIED